MSLYKVFKNEWDSEKHSEAQMMLAWDFLAMMSDCVQRAAREANTYQLDGNDPKAAQFYRRCEGFSKGERTREYKGACCVFKASYGSAIEERAYQLMAEENMSIWSEDYLQWDEFRYETELQLPYGRHFPNSFKGRGGGAGSRPDVRLALGGRYELRYDITADTETSQGHINRKSAGKGSWLKRRSVPFVAEVYYEGA